ncbi:MAG: threonine--tRNA ligase, partial [Clostridia bacterium]|nr:threonine--tRNA ligase [Clostridia bacterium]
TKFTMPREEAIKFMQEKQEPYKVELIQDLPEDAEISFYDQGEFVDLCAGPHLMNTKGIKAFKLISSSMAYWRGDSNKAQLQRIYGTAFNKKEELAAYLEHLEDIKKRDHNKLGREMKLFTTVDVIGQGLPLFTPKGTKMIMKLQRWIEDLEDKEWGYVRTRTPLMAKSDLYKISGHWDHYMDGMFILNKDEEDKETMPLRPMTCPFQYFEYMNEQHSYRDLPYRMAETSTLFRNEDSGEMHGLTRVRQFTITEAHIIMRPDQAEEELTRCVELCDYVMKTLGIDGDVTYRLSKWDPSNTEKYLGDEEYWNNTQQYLRDVMDKNNITYTEADGEAAFYGPKIDIQAKNVYGKEDTMVTIQLDCAAAEKFGMYYIDEKGEKVRPWIIHRTSMGCYERTLAWLIEHYAGKFPTWLCPEQVRVLPISEKYADYAEKVRKELAKNDVDVTVDNRSEKIGYKIREARMDKVPYMLVVGQQEEEDGLVSVRSRYEGNEGQKSLDDFIDALCKEIRTKEIRVELPEDEKKR